MGMWWMDTIPALQRLAFTPVLYHTDINKLKTTPTPNENGSYGIEVGGSYAIFWDPYAIFSVEISWF